MRKTLTTTLLLAACLMCSITTLAQRPYIPDEPYQNPKTESIKSQIGDSVLRQLRALLGDDTTSEVGNSTQSGGSNPSSSSYANPANAATNTSSLPQVNNSSNIGNNGSNGSNVYISNPSVPVTEVNTNDLPLKAPYIEYTEIEEVNTQEPTQSGSYSNSYYTTPSSSSNSTHATSYPTYSAPTTASGATSSAYAANSTTPVVPSPQTSYQPNVVVYPKIKATVGSEIIVEPAQATRTSEVEPWSPSQPNNQNMVQQPVSSGGLNPNVYIGGNSNGNYSYDANGSSVKTPRVSELYTIVDGDTVSVILPQKNLGRFDRGLYNYLYIPKGRWAFGLTASYGEFSTEDVELLNILKDFDIKGKLYSIKPFITYFFRNNQSMGMRLNYTRGEADLGSMVFDFDEDMSFDLKDISYYYEGYSMSVFYRNYVGLDRNSRFSVFNDIDLSFSSGSSRFKRYYDQVIRDTQTTSMGVALNFSPGVCVFIMDNAAFNVSFGVFGVSMHREKQITDGVFEGSRFSSGANFKFNLFNINFGLMIVI